MADRNALMAGYQSRGGVLDTLDLPPVQPSQPPTLLQALTDYVGRGLGVVDHWTMGIPSTMAGLVNGAIQLCHQRHQNDRDQVSQAMGDTEPQNPLMQGY